MTKPTIPNENDPDDRLRQVVVGAVAPKDWDAATDAEWQQLAAAAEPEPFSPERVQRILNKVEAGIRGEWQDAVSPEERDRPPASPSLPKSPVLGFLADRMGSEGGPNVSTFSGYMLAALTATGLLLSVTVVFLVVGLFFKPVTRDVVQSPSPATLGAQSSEAAPPFASGRRQDQPAVPPALHPSSRDPAPAGPIARLARAIDCRWGDLALRPGDRLQSGQSLRLAAGVAEIDFDIGVRLILQGPATLDIEAPGSARLNMGKLTVAVLSPAAHGFRICTPQATFVDQGTEFGVEVSPQGSGSRVHVFRGCVDVAVHASGTNLPPAPERLMENVGARLEGDGSPSLTLMEDTGESFIRTMDQAELDRHTVAYWRFEDRPLGVLLPDTREHTRNVRATMDSSVNGNDLFTYAPWTRPHFSGGVPAAVVPRTGAINHGCLVVSLVGSGKPGQESRDLYSCSRFSHASPLDVEKITPARWTVEASVKPARLQCGRQTFVGRDTAVYWRGLPARLSLEINAQDRCAIRYRDTDDRPHEAVATAPAPQKDHWYHVAAASDGRMLRLYVDALDGRGYQLRHEAALPRDGSTALGRGADAGADTGADTYGWSVGRGIDAQGCPGDAFCGCIDEVRISDAALSPAEFLFSAK